MWNRQEVSPEEQNNPLCLGGFDDGGVGEHRETPSGSGARAKERKQKLRSE